MSEELKPCPFCGGAARIESNRDWHRLYAAHDDDCVFDADDHMLMYPAQPGYLLEIAEVWNRRAASTRTASDTRTAAESVECISALRAAPASQHDACGVALGEPQIRHTLKEITLCYPWGTGRKLVRDGNSLNWVLVRESTGSNTVLADMNKNMVNSAIAATIRAISEATGSPVPRVGGNTKPESFAVELGRESIAAFNQAAAYPAEVDVEAERRHFCAYMGIAEDATFNGSQINGLTYWLAAIRSIAARTQADAGKDSARLNALIGWHVRGGARSEIHPYGHIEFTKREHVIAWCDAQLATTKPENT